MTKNQASFKSRAMGYGTKNVIVEHGRELVKQRDSSHDILTVTNNSGWKAGDVAVIEGVYVPVEVISETEVQLDLRAAAKRKIAITGKLDNRKARRKYMSEARKGRV